MVGKMQQIIAVIGFAISSLVGCGTSLGVFWAIDILGDICRHGNALSGAGFLFK
jgi:hypothetical protein